MTRKLIQYSTLFRVRKHQENIEAQHHAAARRNVFIAEQERTEIIAQQRIALEAAARATTDAVDAFHAHQFLRYERHLAGLAVQKDAQIRDFQRRAEQLRKILETAATKRRMTEKLLEHERHQIRQLRLTAEQKQIDETAVIRAARFNSVHSARASALEYEN